MIRKERKRKFETLQKDFGVCLQGISSTLLCGSETNDLLSNTWFKACGTSPSMHWVKHPEELARPSAGPSRTQTRSLDLVFGKQRRLFGCCVSEPRRWTGLCSCIIFTVMLRLSLWLQCARSLPVRSDRQLGNVAGRAVMSGRTLLTAPTETESESSNSTQETRLSFFLLYLKVGPSADNSPH